MQTTHTLLIAAVWRRNPANNSLPFLTQSASSMQYMLEVSPENQWKYILRTIVSILQGFLVSLNYINSRFL